MFPAQKSFDADQGLNDLTLKRPTATVRELAVSEWRQLKELRIESLEKHPTLFSETLATAKGRTDKEWQDLIQSPTSKIFGAFVGDVTVGITGIFTDRRDPDGKTGILGLSYVREEFRGLGISREFFSQRLAWAQKSSTIEKLVMGHRKGNEQSQSNAEREGFTKINEDKDFTFTDGKVGEVINYAMRLSRSGG
jgi:RimJ/RimL family protein N-acetyltransferase